MDRRSFLLACGGLLLANGVSHGETFPITNPHNPYALVRLRRGKESGLINLDTADGYKAFQWLLRDIQTNTVGYPPRMLGYVLSWMQTFFRQYGYDFIFDVTSGLRLPSTNFKTEGAALNSLHLPDKFKIFKAVDIMVDGIPSEYLGRLAALAQSGGVGFYAKDGHTHVDVGRIRYWRK